MDISMFLARIIGPIFCIFGIALLFQADHMRKVAAEAIANPAILFLLSVIRLILGLVIINLHNYWVQSWEVIITLLGWLAALSGTLVLLFPRSLAEMGKSLMKKREFFSVAGVIVLLLGMYLAYTGYMA